MEQELRYTESFEGEEESRKTRRVIKRQERKLEKTEMEKNQEKGET